VVDEEEALAWALPQWSRFYKETESDQASGAYLAVLRAAMEPFLERNGKAGSPAYGFSAQESPQWSRF